MSVRWHPIKTDKALPRAYSWVLVSTARGVDVSMWHRFMGTGTDAIWECPWNVYAWADLPKPYKKPRAK